MGREPWRLGGLDAKGGGMLKVTVLLLLIVSLSIDELVGDVTMGGPGAASTSLLVVVFAVWGMLGVSDEFFTVSAYVGGLLLCEDSFGLDERISSLSCGVVGADGVVIPGGVVPGNGGGGGGDWRIGL